MPPVKTDYPWFPFYGFDFYNSARVQAMDNAALGAYHRLLWLCWCDGGVPDNVDELRGICRMTAPEFAQTWPRLARCFQPHPEAPEMLYNPRMDAERQKVIRDASLFVRKGREGAERRWAKHRAEKASLVAPQEAPLVAPPIAGDSTSTLTSTSTSDIPPAADAAAPHGGAARRRPVKGRKAPGRPEPAPDVRRVLDFIGAMKGHQLDAPGLIPDRLAQGYTVYDCLLVYWRAARRWKGGHNQVSPFRPAHFGVLLDEARADVKLGEPGGKDLGFAKTHAFLTHKGLAGDDLAAGLRHNGYTADGRQAELAHFADHGRFPDEEASS